MRKWFYSRATGAPAIILVLTFHSTIVIAFLVPFAADAGDSGQPQLLCPELSTDSLNAISANPGAVNVKPGIGWLGRALGFGPDFGVFLGGVRSGDAGYLIGGGNDPKSSNLNSLAHLSVSISTSKSWLAFPAMNSALLFSNSMDSPRIETPE